MSKRCTTCGFSPDLWHASYQRAIDHIEELEAKNKQLREALNHVASHYGSARPCREFAEMVLKGHDDE